MDSIISSSSLGSIPPGLTLPGNLTIPGTIPIATPHTVSAGSGLAGKDLTDLTGGDTKVGPVAQNAIGETATLAKRDTNEKPIKASKQWTPSSRELSVGIDQLSLNKMSRGVEASRQLLPEDAKPTNLELLGTSLNPVTKLEQGFPIPLSALEELGNDDTPKPPLKDAEIKDLFLKVLNDFKAQIDNDPSITNKDEAKKLATENVLKMFKKAPEMQKELIDNGGRRFRLTSDKQLEMFKSAMKSEFAAAGETGNTTLQKLWKHGMEHVDSLDTKISLEGVPVRYDKFEIMGNLRTMMAANPERGDQIFAAMKKVSECDLESARSGRESIVPGYVNASLVDEIIADLTLDEKGVAALKRDTEPCCFSGDVLALNGDRAVVMKQLKELRGNSNNSVTGNAYGFKGGEGEGNRELLMGKVAVGAGMEEFLTPKLQMQIKGTKLGSEADVMGIASRWVKGEEVNTKSWESWLQVRTQYTLETMKNPELYASISSPPSDDESFEMQNARALKEKYELAREGQLETTATRSIPHHIVFDALFASSDSHIKQFKYNDDGELYNFDCARFLTSTPVYSKGGVDNPQLFFNFRSELLGHPLADVPLTEGAASGSKEIQEGLRAIREQVLSMDADAIIANWAAEGLIGDPAFIERQKGIIDGLNSQYCFLIGVQTRNTLEEAAKTLGVPFGSELTDENLKVAINQQLATNLGLKFDPETSPDGLKKMLLEELQKQYSKAKESCWTAIDPSAVEQFKARVEGMQTYFRETPEPTLRGAVHASFGQMKPFMQAVEIMDVNVGAAYMVKSENKSVTQRSLGEIFAKAKTFEGKLGPDFDKLIAEMGENLKAMNAQVKSGDGSIHTSTRAQLSNAGI